MIQSGTFLNVIDNSGAKKVCCIKVSKGYRNRYSTVGDVIIVSVKSIRRKKKNEPKIKKGAITKALVVHVKKLTNHFFFEKLRFNENTVVLLNNQNKLLGNRVFGFIPRNFRFSRFMKIISLSSGIFH